jgi:integrase
MGEGTMSVYDMRKSKAGYKKTGPDAKPWLARGPLDDNGKAPTKAFHTKSEGEKWVAGLVTAKSRGEGIDLTGGKVTFEEYAVDWLATQTHRDSSGAAIESRLRNHAYPVIGHMQLGRVRASHIRKMLKRMSGELAPRTANVAYGNTRSVFKAAVLDRLIPVSPCDGVKPLKKGEVTKVIPLTFDEIIAVADAMPKRWYALVTVAAGLGLRPSEMTGLTVDRVDFLRKTVKVDRQMQVLRKPDENGSRAPRFLPLKTPASYRDVPLPDSIAIELAEHLRKFPVTHEDGLIFTTESGKPIPVWERTEAWRKAADSVGLPGETMHACRHFYASALIYHGESVKVIQERLGHASAMETLDTYGHLWPGSDDGTRTAIDALFSREGRQEGQEGSL